MIIESLVETRMKSNICITQELTKTILLQLLKHLKKIKELYTNKKIKPFKW